MNTASSPAMFRTLATLVAVVVVAASSLGCSLRVRPSASPLSAYSCERADYVRPHAASPAYRGAANYAQLDERPATNQLAFGDDMLAADVLPSRGLVTDMLLPEAQGQDEPSYASDAPQAPSAD